MIEVQVNGEQFRFDDAPTVQALIASLDLGGKRIAVELNAEILPKGVHIDTRLSDGDRIEIVHAIGGG